MKTSKKAERFARFQQLALQAAKQNDKLAIIALGSALRLNWFVSSGDSLEFVQEVRAISSEHGVRRVLDRLERDIQKFAVNLNKKILDVRRLIARDELECVLAVAEVLVPPPSPTEESNASFGKLQGLRRDLAFVDAEFKFQDGWLISPKSLDFLDQLPEWQQVVFEVAKQEKGGEALRILALRRRLRQWSKGSRRESFVSLMADLLRTPPHPTALSQLPNRIGTQYRHLVAQSHKAAGRPVPDWCVNHRRRSV